MRKWRRESTCSRIVLATDFYLAVLRVAILIIGIERGFEFLFREIAFVLRIVEIAQIGVE